MPRITVSNYEENEHHAIDAALDGGDFVYEDDDSPHAPSSCDLTWILAAYPKGGAGCLPPNWPALALKQDPFKTAAGPPAPPELPTRSGSAKRWMPPHPVHYEMWHGGYQSPFKARRDSAAVHAKTDLLPGSPSIPTNRPASARTERSSRPSSACMMQAVQRARRPRSGGSASKYEAPPGVCVCGRIWMHLPSDLKFCDACGRFRPKETRHRSVAERGGCDTSLLCAAPRGFGSVVGSRPQSPSSEPATPSSAPCNSPSAPSQRRPSTAPRQRPAMLGREITWGDSQYGQTATGTEKTHGQPGIRLSAQPGIQKGPSEIIRPMPICSVWSMAAEASGNEALHEAEMNQPKEKEAEIDATACYMTPSTEARTSTTFTKTPTSELSPSPHLKLAITESLLEGDATPCLKLATTVLSGDQSPLTESSQERSQVLEPGPRGARSWRGTERAVKPRPQSKRDLTPQKAVPLKPKGSHCSLIGRIKNAPSWDHGALKNEERATVGFNIRVGSSNFKIRLGEESTNGAWQHRFAPEEDEMDFGHQNTPRPGDEYAGSIRQQKRMSLGANVSGDGCMLFVPQTPSPRHSPTPRQRPKPRPKRVGYKQAPSESCSESDGDVDKELAFDIKESFNQGRKTRQSVLAKRSHSPRSYVRMGSKECRRMQGQA